MKHIGQTLKHHIESHHLRKGDIAKAAGITHNYLSSIFKQDTCDAQLLERLFVAAGLHPATVFDVPEPLQKSFCDIQANAFIGSAMVNINQAENMRELLESKERLIEEKERMIQVLMSQMGSEFRDKNGTSTIK